MSMRYSAETKVGDFGGAAMAIHEVDGLKADESEVGFGGQTFGVAGEAGFLFAEPFGVVGADTFESGCVEGKKGKPSRSRYVLLRFVMASRLGVAGL